MGHECDRRRRRVAGASPHVASHRNGTLWQAAMLSSPARSCVSSASLPATGAGGFVATLFDGCSGSTFFNFMAHLMLESHGARVCSTLDGAYLDPELLIPHKNPFFASQSSWAPALRQMHDVAKSNGASILINGDTDHLRQPQVASTLLYFGTPMVSGWRENALDRAVCLVRDCFARSHKTLLGTTRPTSATRTNS